MFQTFGIYSSAKPFGHGHDPRKRKIIFQRSSSVLFQFIWLTILLTGINGSLADNTTTTTTTTITINASPINSTQSTTTPTSTDKLIRDILLNQSSSYYDELVLEQLLAAANMSSPPPETWRAIVQLLNKQNTDNNNNNNKAANGGDSDKSGQAKKTQASTSKTKYISLLTLKQEEDGENETDGSGGQTDSDNLTINKHNGVAKIESAIDEFPPDFMSDQWRQNGGFLIHVLIFIYLSIVLAVICDNYFLKSLEFISEALHLSSDIAGATFMAIGTSAPELFTSVIGVFISDNDIGTGTIVGSAVFNLIAIPGACGFAAYYNLKTMPKINPFPIIRDTIFYVLTIITLILCIKDNKVDWIESITLIALYIIYIIIMYFNAQISHLVGNQQPYRHCSDEYLMIEDGQKRNESKRKQNEMEQTSMDMVVVQDETQPLLLTDDSVKRLSPPPAYQSRSVAYSDETARRKSPTSKYSNDIDLSKIQLTLAENGKFKEIQQHNGDVKKSPTGKHSMDLEQSIELDSIDTDWTDNPFIRFIMFPFHVVFFITLPKPTRFCFVVTFVSSIVWIACLTYFIVWMVTLVGYTLGIPDTVSGITVLAAGTSIPELISSYLIVKKAGLADMAICNSIGSNIFDILFCLGLPWLLKSSIVIVTNGFGLATLANSYIPIQSTALPITSLTLLLTIGAMILIFKASQWHLNLRLGILCSIVYVIFVVTSTSLELNV